MTSTRKQKNTTTVQKKDEKKVKKTYTLREEVWLYPGMAGWHFVYVGKKVSEEIKALFSEKKRGFGSIPVLVTLGKTCWKTSIFPDKKSGAYLLPIKADVRKKENVFAGEKVSYSLTL